MDPGETVSLRITTPAGHTEVVGVVIERSPEALVLRRRDGSLQVVPLDSVVAGRIVPPGPARRIAVDDLARLTALGWRAPETGAVGEWLLRAAGGFTARANSALPVGDPGLPLDDAADAVERWYAARGMTARAQVVAGAEPAGLTAVLSRRGWAGGAHDHVMTAEIAHVLRAAPASVADVAVQDDDAPDDGWLAAYRSGDQPLPATARAVLTNHPDAGFLSVREADTCAAVARVAVDGRWAGLFAVEVAPSRRGAGLGTAVVVAALRRAAARGARHSYLQVQESGAVAFWEQLGFSVHHDYRHWTLPV